MSGNDDDKTARNTLALGGVAATAVGLAMVHRSMNDSDTRNPLDDAHLNPPAATSKPDPVRFDAPPPIFKRLDPSANREDEISTLPARFNIGEDMKVTVTGPDGKPLRQDDEMDPAEPRRASEAQRREKANPRKPVESRKDHETGGPDLKREGREIK